MLLVTLLSVRYVMRLGHPRPIELQSIHTFVDPAMAQALSTWLLLMVPVGLPLLYFAGGLLAHVGIGLTGGAPRTIGASMRAVGYALGPSLLALALMDLPLYFDVLPIQVFGILWVVIGLTFWVLSAIALARTHRISLARCFLVALLPFFTFMVAILLRASLHLQTIPGMSEPIGDYYIP